MAWSNLDWVGESGAAMCLLGAALLWQFRATALDWLREFFRIWRGEIRSGGAADGGTPERTARRRLPAGAIALACAVVLIFLGQVLFFLDLTF